MTYIVKLQDDRYNKLEFEFRDGIKALNFMETCGRCTMHSMTATMEFRSEVCEGEPDENEE